MPLSSAELIEYHRFLLADQARLQSYQKAITQTVRPGDVVLDIGTGTGILAFFACQAGARRVYAVEASPAIELARELCKKNRLQDRVTLIHDMSFNVYLPERADVVVSDTGETFGLQGGILNIMIDARKRLLKEGARFIPSSVELFIALVRAPDKYGRIEEWKPGLYGLDFSPVRRFAANNCRTVRFRPEELVSDPSSLLRIPLSEAENPYVHGTASVIATSAGVLHGIAGWGSYELAPEISFSNSPSVPTVNWAHCFFPLEAPISLDQGDCVRVTITTHAGLAWRWQVNVLPANPGGAPNEREREFDQSDFWGFPRTRAGLMKGANPKLSRKGEAELFLLTALNGRAKLEELGSELLSRYSDIFPSQRAASLFLKEIISRCA